MTNPQFPMGAGRAMPFPRPPRGETVARYDTYEQAQSAVERLVQSDFPVQAVSIVGERLQSFERVTGRLSYGRAAGAGALSGLWLGLFFGIVLTFFSANSSVAEFIGAALIGAAFGMVFGLISYSITRRRRDFSSVMQVIASTYSILVEPEQANRARNVLGIDATAVPERPAE